MLTINIKYGFYRRKTESELDKATADMVQTKQDRLKGIPYLREIPEEGWTPESISSHLDNIMGLGDLKGTTAKLCSFVNISSIIMSSHI